MVDKSEMIFGVRAVIEAIQAGKEIDKILVKKDIQSDLSKELFAALKGTLIPVQRVPVERINRITRKNHQGVIAFISSVTYQKTEDLVPFLFEEGKNPLFVMLDGVTDVRNFGAIARTCECAAVDAVIIPAKGSVTVNADAMKTSAGALHVLPVCREQNLKVTLQYLNDTETAVLKILQSRTQILFAADRQCMQRTCGSLHGIGIHRYAATRRNNHRIHRSTFTGTGYRTEVTHIRYAIQHHKKRILALLE